MSALAFEDVTFRYPGAAAPALAGLSLAVAPGEIVALVGRVGAGASTALLVAADLAPRVTGGALEGRVRRAARPGLVLPEPWTQVSGMAFTVRDEVAFGPANLGLDRAEIAARVDAALARFGVTHLAARDPTTLSGGELQRVILAGVTATAPGLLLLDEFTAELDPEGCVAAWNAVRALAREGAAVLVASSDLDAVALHATRVVWLERGTARSRGAPAEVLGDPALWSGGPGSTGVAAAWCAGGLAAPYPVTVAAARARLG